jgi:outer membrane protein OmpA-like peptidoglycan-associated protein
MRALITFTAVSLMLLVGTPSFACLPDGFSFALGSARLNPREHGLIERVVREFRAQPGRRVRLIASTDAIGPADANLRLSRRRGEAVKAALVRHGIPARAIDIVAEGAGGRRDVDPYARGVAYDFVDEPHQPGGDADRC